MALGGDLTTPNSKMRVAETTLKDQTLNLFFFGLVGVADWRSAAPWATGLVWPPPNRSWVGLATPLFFHFFSNFLKFLFFIIFSF